MKPMPPDFPEKAWGCLNDLARHYKVHWNTVRAWRDQVGGEDPRRKGPPVPSDFALLARDMNKTELRQHYGVGKRAVDHWCRNTGVAPRHGNSRPEALRPVPADFAQVAPTMKKKALREHYKCWDKVLDRWIAETGVLPAPHNPAPPFIWRGHGGPKVHRLERVKSMYDEAADTIRRERFAVYRCNAKGAYDPKGKLWRVGMSVLTPDELLKRADRYRRRAA